MMSKYESIAWRVVCRRRNWCGPQEVVCDSDTDSDSDRIVCDSDSDASSVDDRVFECECGHKEHGQDADDCRYLVTIHADCGCTDCDYEDCVACEDAECYQKDVCANCETKYDKEEEERLEGLNDDE